MMKIGFFGKQNSFAREVLRRLKSENTVDEFLAWQSGDKAPSTPHKKDRANRPGLCLGEKSSNPAEFTQSAAQSSGPLSLRVGPE
jgi:hypothetical protein